MDVFKRLTKKKGIKRVADFLDSPWFTIAFGVAAFLFYALNLPLVTVGIFAVCGTFICLFCWDTRPGLTLVLLVMFSFQYKDDLGAYLSKPAIILYCIAGPIILFAMGYRVIKRRVYFEGWCGLLGMALFSCAMLLGGVFTKYYTAWGFAKAAALATALFCCYAYFAFTLKKREDNLLYLARVLAVGVCLIAAELFEYYIRNYTWGTPFDADWKYYLHLGWSISNMVGEMIVFALPAVFYLIYKEEKGYWYWLVVAIALAAVYFTFARNALLWSIICTLLCTAANCLFGKHRKINRIVVLIVLALGVGVGVVLYSMGYLHKLMRFFLDVGLTDRGRFKIWKKHLGLFTEYPILGVGFDSYSQFWESVSKAHNNIVQMLASTGIVGFGMYLFHRLQTVGMIFKKPTIDRLFIGGCILISLMMAMLSSTFFHIYSIVHYSVILLVLEKSGDKK